jgi:hypothetical protein
MKDNLRNIGVKDKSHVMRDLKKHQHTTLRTLLVGLGCHGESLRSLNLSIQDVLLVICVRLPLSSLQRVTKPMCPGDNGMRQSKSHLIQLRVLPLYDPRTELVIF